MTTSLGEEKEYSEFKLRFKKIVFVSHAERKKVIKINKEEKKEG